jgi:hypothetical protein
MIAIIAKPIKALNKICLIGSVRDLVPDDFILRISLSFYSALIDFFFSSKISLACSYISLLILSA